MGRLRTDGHIGRRRLLVATGGAVAALAGCAGSPDGSSDGGGGNGGSGDGDGASGGGDGDATRSPAAPGTPTREETPMTDQDLDLREANVTGVEFERDGRTFRFSVTLFHDDDGESAYANWWQVESLGGEQLGRRKLLHAHSTDPFTRSETIEIPDGIACVVVRGHDQTHGYGGQAMLVNLDTTATKPVRQGSEKRSFSEDDCP